MPYLFVQLTSAGTDTGPFNLYSNSDGYISAFESGVPKSSLLSGITVDAPVGTIMVRISSDNQECSNFVDIPVTVQPSSTTTSTSSSTSTTSTSTTEAIIACDTIINADGGIDYPSEKTIDLGSDTGYVSFNSSTGQVPDRFIVYWNSSVVIDTGYQGGTAYDFGGGSRNSFKASLIGKTDPIFLTVYPDFANFPDDGYPRVSGPVDRTSWFDKTLASPETINVRVYSPINGSAWAYQAFCPNTGPTTTTSTSSTSTTSTTTTSTTTAAPEECGGQVSYSGGVGWPTSRNVFLGTGTGVIGISADADGLPDRFLVRIGGNVVIDTGFQGTANYDFGGINRNTFKSWISSRIDPITGLGYPDFTTYPDDGYPRVCCGSNPVLTYGLKTTADELAVVEVYGSSPQTGWRYTLYCVGTLTTTTTSTTQAPTTTSTSTSTSSTSTSTTSTTTLAPTTTTTTSTQSPTTSTTTTENTGPTTTTTTTVVACDTCEFEIF